VTPSEPPPPAEAKWYEPVASPTKIETATSSVKLGALMQGQFESVGSSGLDGMSNNLFMRRARILLGATLFDDLEFFFETDFADLHKANAEGVKSTPGMNIQDAFFTYKGLGDPLKVDFGYILPPSSHNGLQSAASLYGWDYYANSFRNSNAFNTSAGPVGRDLGLQLRGLLLDKKLEYRLSALQGLREPATMTDVQAQNMFRLAARVQVNVLDPETGFFYGGTYFGAKQILSFGAFYDFQDEYKHWGVDGFLDMPLGPGALTVQANLVQYDGGDYIAALPKQTSIMAEAGYTFAAARLSPIVRFETRTMDESSAASPDETRISGGLAYWLHGHKFNLKAFYTRVNPDPAPHGYNAINLQAQFFWF
jgi:hypothetical protein